RPPSGPASPPRRPPSRSRSGSSAARRRPRHHERIAEGHAIMNDEKRRQGARLERTHASAQFTDGKFQNPSGASAQLKGPSLSIMGEFLFRRGRREPSKPLPLDRPH